MTDPETPELQLNPTVLIIDDSPENRYVVRRTLTRAGMEVIEAGTGAEGRQLAAGRAEEIDLLILDVNLPDTTGFELCQRFKSDPLTAHIPVIHLSQSAVDDGSRVRGLEGGADAYLTDPVHGSVLVATVRALLRMREAEDALRRHAEDADRLVVLNSALANASTGPEVIAALINALTNPFRVHVAYLIPARPWITRARRVFPDDGEIADQPLPTDKAQVIALLDAILADGRPASERLLYTPAGDRWPRAWMLLPLIAYGREMGTLLIEFAEGITLPARNQARLGIATERAAEALERARLFDEQREIASELQASLLPVSLPEVNGLSIAAQYRAGAEGMVVGGDFYDVFAGDGGWGMIIGDVCGRGAAAAARTSLARHTTREAARHDRDPASLLSALENAIRADKRDHLDLISAICLAADPVPDGIALRYAIAGHPLPIVVRADGSTAQLGTPGPILGINAGAVFHTDEILLAPGDALFLYTDGVTEARRAGVLFGEQRLMALLGEKARAGATVEELATVPVDTAADYNEIHEDDMATLVLRAAPRMGSPAG